METTIEIQQSQPNNKFNLLDIFLEIANEPDSLSLQFEQFKDSDVIFNNSKNFSAVQKFCKIKKINVIKNILKSFQKYIEDANKEEQEILWEVAKKPYSFCQLKKLIKRNLKTYGKRWNMKLKYLIQQCSYKSLFEYYLQNKSTNWLNYSKVQNREDHKIVIEFILEAIKNPEYCQQIKHYKKQNKSSNPQD